ncbi:MerR family transcriptional regulator [Porphyromonadaceae bacterium W3.11]|nr:MerR family transcriptional regulator [Porphyromonadaceae bacterium W3.11]
MARRKKSNVKGVYWRKQGHDKDQRLFYSISEVAEMFDIEEHMLRTWEKHTPLKPQRSVSSGARMYTNEDLKLVERLRYLIVEKGIQLSMVSKFIDLGSLETELKIRDKLLDIRKKVTALRAMVDEQLDEANPDIL